MERFTRYKRVDVVRKVIETSKMSDVRFFDEEVTRRKRNSEEAVNEG